MTDKKQSKPSEKDGLHPRNKHRSRYNFDELIKVLPDLAQYVSLNKYNDQSVDFADPDAVITLNRALLKQYYGVNNWAIPPGYLCPPIPGRADYLHYIADLLASGNKEAIPTGNGIKVLDIGVGANCVYPLIGNHEYGWGFVCTDTDPVAVKSAQQIVADNNLADHIKIRQQTNPSNIYAGIVSTDEVFDVAICNPPFHASLKEAESSTIRKLDNLGKDTSVKPVLNFGGQNTELWYPGGEAAFISKMIYQSSKMPQQCFWFTTLVSKKDNLFAIEKALKKVAVFDMVKINMAQGQKQSRVVAWTFLTAEQKVEWRLKRWAK